MRLHQVVVWENVLLYLAAQSPTVHEKKKSLVLDITTWGCVIEACSTADMPFPDMEMESLAAFLAHFMCES